MNNGSHFQNNTSSSLFLDKFPLYNKYNSVFRQSLKLKKTSTYRLGFDMEKRLIALFRVR